MAKRRHKGLGMALIVLVAVILLAVALLRYVFVVRSVQVTSGSGVNDEEVVRTARIGFGTSIFAVDAAEIAARINATGTLAVDGVRVRYPDTVVISVRERGREAMLLHMGKIRILDEEGCVVESREEVPDMDLVYVSGMRVMDFVQGSPVRAADGQMEAYRAVMGQLKAQLAKVYVSELDVSEPEKIYLITRTGIRVELGGAADMENKIAWMKSAVADLEQRGEAGGTLDVRSGNKADYSKTRPSTEEAE